MSLKSHISLATKIGFASHQNSVALIQEFRIENLGDTTLSNLVVRLDSNPSFLEPKIWKIDQIDAGATTKITDRNVKLDAATLMGLTESLSGEISINITSSEDAEATPITLLDESHPIELLAKSHWGGTGSMPELLPAFCMPNDPAVDKVLKATADVLRRAGKEASINGYENRSRSRTWELTSAIWSAVAGLNLDYALPPASFELSGQKVRTPGAILEGRLATCLDSSMLFASALEQARLNPLIILSEGHAFVGVWLQPQQFSQLITEEASPVRKRVELNEILVFETTLITESPAPPFSTAVESAIKKLSDEEFLMAIDIQRARMRKIKPLGVTNTTTSTETSTTGPEVIDSLEEAPALPGFDVEITQDPENANDRVAQWQRKLLDLTARNKLLHLPERTKHVPLTCPDPGTLEDLLAAGKTIRIASFPDFDSGGRDSALYAQQNNADLKTQYATDALSSNEVMSSLPAKKLEAELIDLYRKARTDINEGGANTLFLALGFLNWKKSAEDTRVYRAPLILLPVKLKRKSALSGVTMTVHEDEPRFNLTLLELLKQDFDLDIPGLDGSLPEDDSGIDVTGIWNHMRVQVKDIPGFEVTTDTALGTFSFAKYLMWKDLTDRREQLTSNAVVRHLMERGEEKFNASGASYPDPTTLDKTIPPSELFAPLPADSSQLAAVVASANGCNFVLDGPPGTGKSQTIANMIVHNLSIGKRVLFVAEKMAALDVVHRRLAEQGLSEFCLEVHSHKTSKTDILQQLDRAWSTRGDLSASNWAKKTSQLKHLRDRLNTVCERLHSPHSNGLTVYRAIGQVVRHHDSSTPRLKWSNGTQHTVDEFEALGETARRLALNYSAFLESPKDFSIIEKTEWSNGWQDSIISTAQLLPGKIGTLRTATDKLKECCQFNTLTDTSQATQLLANFLNSILKAHGKDLSFAFSPGLTEKLEAVKKFTQLLEEYHAAEKKLSVRYAVEAARHIDTNELDAKWSEAGQKFWFLATLAQKNISKELGVQANTSALPNVEQDSPILRKLGGLLSQMDQLSPSLTGIPGYTALTSDLPSLSATTQLAADIQQQLPQLISTPDELISLKAAVKRLVTDGNELLSPDGQIFIANSALQHALSELDATVSQFSELCASENLQSYSLDQLEAASKKVTSKQATLRAWCGWRRVRVSAIHQNLTPLVEGIENGSIPKDDLELVFLTAYSKWFAANAIDNEPVLRDFVTAEHMESIEEFRRIDEQVSKLAVEYTRTVLCGRLPKKSEVGKKDGYGILKHEIQKKRMHKPLRQLASEMGEAFTNLAPCMLMSPLSIAQYLPADQQQFDLVIFDEASQISPWDAVGSIARGKQVVIAGDPRQMPPTNFFQRGASGAEFDNDTEGDLESILDECLAVGVPRHSLSWHYRSRHESLIAFSNHSYYGGNLITFPAAVTRESAVSWVKVDGVYAKGKSRTNQAEAKAMVAETVKRLTNSDFTGAGYSLAIITLNSDQQRLVEDLLDSARKKHPEIEPYFSDSLSEPVVVKNLETVQGDERDVILFGIGYGPTEPGSQTMSMSFGPLNRDGGERRLNVALTRSKQEMMVFTSFDPSMIDLNRTSSRAVRDLKHFLEFADRGPRSLKEAVKGSVGGYDSPFEEAVSNRLQEKGWQVVPQVGVSRFRIDLGIVHPDRPGDFLVGIECDGATYHSGATARDRDKVRAAVLEGLGWNLLRVWSTDWFTNPEGEIERLDTALRELYESTRSANESDLKEAEVSDAPSTPDNVIEIADEVTPSEPLAMVASSQASTASEPTAVAQDDPPMPATAPEDASKANYITTDFATLQPKIEPDLFYDNAYTSTLVEMIELTLESEAPILDELLVQRIARAHDFKRSGRRIREKLLELIDEHFHLREDPVEGSFIWKTPDGPATHSVYRSPTDSQSTRRIEEISYEEISAAHRDGNTDATDIARTFGIKRLTANVRDRIERAIAVSQSSN